MVLTALRGALGFLTRAPVGESERAWDAFRATPAAFPLAGYVIGAVLALPFLPPAPDPVTAFAFLAWVYVVTGIPHADAVADLGDAAVVHGLPDERRAVMRDTTVGVGAVLALGLVLIGLWSAGLALAPLPVRVVGLVVAAEVGAKLAMASVACLGTATHEGLGSAVAGGHGRRDLILPVLVALPAALLTWPHPAAGTALVTALLAGIATLRWGNTILGGISGDVIGAANEVARLAALLTGVVVWMHW
ncbi:adenosylcobinamide-GDP ribazoletransferase [Natronomonas sp. EA1]|uniref:adenosylcobinamide-GDP ribazoletransferase n=1 Tax=Natronomonas sp. EA1 TaxID=3421655 RepID=UPI003EB6A854